MQRNTKIIATLGPATSLPEVQRSLIEAGAGIFRLNMSHAPTDWCRQMVTQIRSIAAELGTDVAVLMDLQGPTIRTGELPQPLALEPGQMVEIVLPGAQAKLPLSTGVNYPGLAADVKVGATMVVDNGALLFKVISADQERVTCEVLTGGSLGSRRHINLPGTRVNLPGLTEKDRLHLQVALEIGCDFIAMSFVRDAAHVRELRAVLKEQGSVAKIVAKIEDQSAVNHIEEIIHETDVIMVARGDLGMEVLPEELPIIQRRIVSKCHRLGKPVIVATHMLESMISSPMPTRAEMTDVANAVFEQADAIMLSGETSTGKYPFRCVEMLDRIARRVEQQTPDFDNSERVSLKTDKHRVIKAAVTLANSLDDAQIIVFTLRGVMARITSHFRPAKAPIFAFAPTVEVARGLHLCRSVVPFVIDFSPEDGERMVDDALQLLRSRQFIRAGQPLIIVSDVLHGEEMIDAIILRRLE